MRLGLWVGCVVAACGEAVPPAGEPVETGPPGPIDPPADPAIDTPRDTDTVSDETSVPDDSAEESDEPLAPLASPPVWSGGFVEIAHTLWPQAAFEMSPGDAGQKLDPQNGVAFWADLDGDGTDELIVGAEGLSGEPSTRVARWVPRVPQGLRLDPALTFALGMDSEPPFAAVDLDGDGRVDLIGSSLRSIVRWGGPDGWSEPVSLVADTPNIGNAGLGVAVMDVDHDGWLDLLLSHPGCERSMSVALQTAPGVLTWVPSVADEVSHGFGSAIVASPMEDGRTVAFAVLHACETVQPHPGWYREVAPAVDGSPRFEVYDATPQDAWWRQMPVSFGAPITRVAPMGAGFRDLDSDGLLDVVVTTGTARQGLLKGRGDGTFVDPRAPWAIQRSLGPTGTPIFPWGVDFPDLDMDGRADLLFSVGDDAGSFMALAGLKMANAAYWNAGDFGWVDVSSDVGLAELGNYRALGLADPDRDGDADVVFGGKGTLPAAYRNDLDVGTEGISVRLRGTSSNPLGVGARVEVEVAGLAPQVGVMGGVGNPNGMSTPTLFFGAGTAPKVDMLRVIWPSGYTQEVRDLIVGRAHKLVEPSTLAVRDKDRQAPADGVSTIQVAVTPRRPDGTVNATAAVSFVLQGSGRLLPATESGGTWVVDIVAPQEPGRSVVEAAIDGVALGVRPKLTWVAVP